MASVEQQQQKFRSQAAVIDEIVDTTFEVNQAGAGRCWRGACSQKCPQVTAPWGSGRAEAGSFTHPCPTNPCRLEKRTSGSDPRRTPDTDFNPWQSAHLGALGRIPKSAGRIVQALQSGGPNRVFKPQEAPCPHWLGQGAGKGIGAHARTSVSRCSL